jgi:hypothetical protein
MAQIGDQSNCETCGVTVTFVVEQHWAGWLDDEGDQLSYVPTLHDHSVR